MKSQSIDIYEAIENSINAFETISNKIQRQSNRNWKIGKRERNEISFTRPIDHNSFLDYYSLKIENWKCIFKMGNQ